jgi:ATP-dependent Clp protease adaptor protein ClpS
MNEEILSPSETTVDELLNSYKLLLHNDEHNSFEWIILCLITVLNISSVNAEQLALIAHNKGKVTIKHGSHDDLLLFKDAFNIRGIDTTIES